MDSNNDGVYEPVGQNPFITTGTPTVRLKNADANGKDPRGFG